MNNPYYPEWLGPNPRAGGNHSKQEDAFIHVAMREGRTLFDISQEIGRTTNALIARLQATDPVFKRFDGSFEEEINCHTSLDHIYSDYDDEMQKLVEAKQVLQVRLDLALEKNAGMEKEALDDEASLKLVTDHVMVEVRKDLRLHGRLIGVVIGGVVIAFILARVYIN